MNIIVIGNSVGIRIRPPRNNRRERHFCEVIANELESRTLCKVNIYNRCRSGVTIDDLILHEIDYISGNSPDIIIIICGINEAVSRPLPKRIYQYLNKTRPIGGVVWGFFHKINSGINHYIFPHIIKAFSLRGWYSANLFSKKLQFLIGQIDKESKALVIPVTILPCTQRIEKLLPGSGKSIGEFNKLISKYSCIDNVVVADISNDIPQGKEGEYTPDGIHMNSKAHEILANKIIEIISSHDIRESLKNSSSSR